MNKRMNRSSELKISAEADCDVGKPSELAIDRQKVGESLSRVAMSAVTAVDDGNRRISCRNERRTLFRMAH